MTSSLTSEIEKLTARGWTSLNKFCKLADISYPTALKLVKEEKLVAIKVGGVQRVYADEVRRFLSEGNKVTVEGSNTPQLPSNNEQDE